MSWTLIIITLVIGLILVALEIVAIPGLIVGICGAALMIFSIWQTFITYGSFAGTIVLIATLVTCAILIAIFMKTKTWKKFSMNEESDSKVNQIDKNAIQIGAQGITIARLAPTGKAIINGEQVEVHSINKYIEPNKKIEVIAVDGYRIDVREVTDERFEN